jgi:hypothetical protein
MAEDTAAEGGSEDGAEDASGDDAPDERAWEDTLISTECWPTNRKIHGAAAQETPRGVASWR